MIFKGVLTRLTYSTSQNRRKDGRQDYPHCEITSVRNAAPHLKVRQADINMGPRNMFSELPCSIRVVLTIRDPHNSKHYHILAMYFLCSAD